MHVTINYIMLTKYYSEKTNIIRFKFNIKIYAHVLSTNVKILIYIQWYFLHTKYILTYGFYMYIKICLFISLLDVQSHFYLIIYIYRNIKIFLKGRNYKLKSQKEIFIG